MTTSRALLPALMVAALIAAVGGALMDPSHGGAYVLAALPVLAACVFFAVLLRGESR